MKNVWSFYKILVFTLCVCFVNLTYAQNEVEPTNVKDIVAAKVEEKLNPGQGKSAALDKAMKAKGHKAQKGKVYGKEWTFEQDGKKVTQSVYFQDYKKPGKSGVIGKVVTVSGNDKQEYDFYIESSDQNPEEREEFFVDEQGKVQKTHSWFTCIRKALLTCSAGCVTGITTCWNGSWVGYLTCLSNKCGICYLKKYACCSCDCSFFCKWAAGCCDR